MATIIPPECRSFHNHSNDIKCSVENDELKLVQPSHVLDIIWNLDVHGSTSNRAGRLNSQRSLTQ